MQHPAQQYRERAGRIRLLLDGIGDPALRQTLEVVAIDYDQLAEVAEQSSELEELEELS
jgi:hypothetical protein